MDSNLDSDQVGFGAPLPSGISPKWGLMTEGMLQPKQLASTWQVESEPGRCKRSATPCKLPSNPFAWDPSMSPLTGRRLPWHAMATKVWCWCCSTALVATCLPCCSAKDICQKCSPSSTRPRPRRSSAFGPTFPPKMDPFS